MCAPRCFRVAGILKENHANYFTHNRPRHHANKAPPGFVAASGAIRNKAK